MTLRTIHFVGIGGIGMSGIAEILNGAGLSVTGCDLKRSAATDLLASRGIAVTIGHDPSHVDGNDLSSSPRPSRASIPKSTPRARRASAS